MPIESFDPQGAHAAMSAAGEHVFLDVRTQQEYEQGHPEGAINLPWAVLDQDSGRMAPNPHFVPTVQKHFGTDTRIFLSCAAGMRSMNAARDLQAVGYADLVNVDGGFAGRRNPSTGAVVIPGWADSGLPVTQSPSTYAELEQG